MLSAGKKEIKYLLLILLSAIGLLLVLRIKLIVVPFLLGIILAYLFNPIIEFLLKREFSRQGAITILLIFIVNVFLISGIVCIPLFINELEKLAEVLPGYVAALGRLVEGIHQEYDRIQLPGVLREGLNETLNRIEGQLSTLIESLIEIIINSIGFFFSLLLAPVITYYILKDINDLKRKTIKLFPPGRRRFIYRLSREVNQVLVGFLRGQVWISLLVGLMVTVGLCLLRIRFFLLLGLLAAITNMIPYIGPILGAIPALLLALMSSYLHALAVALFYILIQQLESYLIAPRIISKNVGLHPLAVIFILLAGAELAGIWGLLLAVPAAGCIKIIVKNILIGNHF